MRSSSACRPRRRACTTAPHSFSAGVVAVVVAVVVTPERISR
ncbi:hypothetical protein [Kineococcus sp. G2]